MAREEFKERIHRLWEIERDNPAQILIGILEAQQTPEADDETLVHALRVLKLHGFRNGKRHINELLHTVRHHFQKGTGAAHPLAASILETIATLDEVFEETDDSAFENGPE